MKAKMKIVLLSWAIIVCTSCTSHNTPALTASATLIEPTATKGVTPLAFITRTSSIAEQFTPVPWYENGFEGLQGGGYGSPDFRPASLAVKSDGTLFLVTTANSYIFHVDPYGKLLKAWGGFMKVNEGEKAPTGLFNEPWGITLSPDGFLYITDTWNHRVQKFTQDGAFVLEWGKGGIGDKPYELFGPRGIECDSFGHVIVVDTGNKRLVVYDKNGSFISQLGGEGVALGQFNEPVGIAVDRENNNIYIADSWNCRIQEIQIDAKGLLKPKSSWIVEGWGSKSLEHKPFLCVYQGDIFATDPEHNLILKFNPKGDLLKSYDMKSRGILADGIVTGIASDPTGGLWVSDYKYNMWSHLKP